MNLSFIFSALQSVGQSICNTVGGGLAKGPMQDAMVARKDMEMNQLKATDEMATINKDIQVAGLQNEGAKLTAKAQIQETLNAKKLDLQKARNEVAVAQTKLKGELARRAPSNGKPLFA